MWNAYFDWYFEDYKLYQEPKIVSPLNKILRLIEANKWLKEDKTGPEASGASFLAYMS